MSEKNSNTHIVGNPAYAVGLLQGRAYARMTSTLSTFLSQYGLSIPEWKLLGQAYEHGDVQLSNLAELLDYDPPMVTKLVKNLEKKKLLTRQPAKHDERAKIIIISTSGKTLIQKIDPQIKLLMRGLLNGVTPEQLKSYIAVLQAIVANSTP